MKVLTSIWQYLEAAFQAWQDEKLSFFFTGLIPFLLGALLIGVVVLVIHSTTKALTVRRQRARQKGRAR